MRTRSRAPGWILLGAAFTMSFSSCGTLLWSERQGQERGTGADIDWAVVGLDGIGLFFFVIPGLAAFGVDFYTGAIFLPPDRRTSSVADAGMQPVIVTQNLDVALIESTLRRELGLGVDLGTTHVIPRQVQDLGELEALLSEAAASSFLP